MITEVEKRETARYGCDISIVYFLMQKGRRIRAKLLNFSDQGVFLITKEPVLPGTTVVVRLDKDTDQEIPCSEKRALRSISLVTVKWCQEATVDGRRVYEIGAKYMVGD
jgi:hypothetical protein